MHVLLINGSPHEKGCTYTALSLVAGELNAAGITKHRELWALALKYVVPAALLIINITSFCTL